MDKYVQMKPAGETRKLQESGKKPEPEVALRSVKDAFGGGTEPLFRVFINKV